MAKLTDKSALITPANDDLLYIVDVSDTTDSAQGTSKKIEFQNLVPVISYPSLLSKPSLGSLAPLDYLAYDSLVSKPSLGSLAPLDFLTYSAIVSTPSLIPTSYLDTDGTLAANSDSKLATQKATKTYADTKLTNSMTTDRLLGRTAAGTGVIGEITLGANLSLASATLNLGFTYETGTWTPSIQGTTTAGTVTYVNRLGAYTRVGNICFITLYLNWNSGTGSGNLRVSGLPFTVDATYYSSVNVGWNINVTLPANTVATCYADLNTTNLIMYTQTVGGGTGLNVAYDAVGNINISGVYRIA